MPEMILHLAFVLYFPLPVWVFHRLQFSHFLLFSLKIVIIIAKLALVTVVKYLTGFGSGFVYLIFYLLY